jgi:SAM-dependent methyltransferase
MISDALAIGQYSRYDRMTPVSHARPAPWYRLRAGAAGVRHARSLHHTGRNIVTDIDRGQVSATAAEVYDALFVPALFVQWTDTVLDLAAVRSGHRVLDVGCGTGVLASAALVRVGEDGGVAGLDPNDGMLAVAQRAEPRIEWRRGVAERIPFPDNSFDRTVSQFALMFFTDAEKALDEVDRVTRPNGRTALAVWDDLVANRGYDRLAHLVEGMFGADAGDAIRAPFQFGGSDVLVRLAADALIDPLVTRHAGVARFESLTEWLHAEIYGWTLADAIEDEGFDALLVAAHRELADLVDGDGKVAFDVSAYVMSGSTR